MVSEIGVVESTRGLGVLGLLLSNPLYLFLLLLLLLACFLSSGQHVDETRGRARVQLQIPILPADNPRDEQLLPLPRYELMPAAMVGPRLRRRLRLGRCKRDVEFYGGGGAEDDSGESAETG